jgi:hypothetical protein
MAEEVYADRTLEASMDGSSEMESELMVSPFGRGGGGVEGRIECPEGRWRETAKR